MIVAELYISLDEESQVAALVVAQHLIEAFPLPLIDYTVQPALLGFKS